MTLKKQHIFFPGLDGLRFIAALCVIIIHIEQIKLIFGFNNLYKNKFLHTSGVLGVTLFFVLSGFLITYLLLTEKDKFKNIEIKNFYIRRILRIWPLYFLIISLGLFIFPQFDSINMPNLSDQIPNHFWTKVFLFSCFLPNISFLLFPAVPYISQTWSIGIEEQFYLMWPLIIKKTERYFTVFLTIIFSLIGLIVIIRLAFYHELINLKVFLFIDNYFSMLRIGCMSIGGIGAYLLFFNKKILNIIFRKDFQLLVIITLFQMLYSGVYIICINHEVYSILFCILILNISSNPNSIIKLDNKVLNFLGKISYGLYMFHPLIITISILILKKFSNFLFNDFNSNAILYLISISLTIIISSLSYYFFEKRFLKLKYLFSRISSGKDHA